MNILAIHRSSKSGAGIAQASLYTKMRARAHTHTLSLSLILSSGLSLAVRGSSVNTLQGKLGASLRHKFIFTMCQLNQIGMTAIKNRNCRVPLYMCVAQSTVRNLHEGEGHIHPQTI